MIEVSYDGSLEGLFAILDEVCQNPRARLPDRIKGTPRRFFDAPVYQQPELFGELHSESAPSLQISFQLAGLETVLGGTGTELYEISIQAYEIFLHAWMSELPIEAEIIRFAWNVITAARSTGDITASESRTVAERVISDRGDPATKTVLDAAHQVRHEIHRLMGFLRFSPNREGVYIARCAPDHFSLPGLAHHFTLRFGPIPWAVIDEKRRLMLICALGQKPQMLPIPPFQNAVAEDPIPSHNSWEELWRNYHRSINNETRSNPRLQRQCMPLRYWKYLSEMNLRE
jgi:probable DNA metabolism protein